MTTIRVTARVGVDGNIVVPVGTAEAGTEVDVTMEPARPKLTQAEWEAVIKRTAGSITDPTFKRHAQGDYEEREQL